MRHDVSTAAECCDEGADAVVGPSASSADLVVAVCSAQKQSNLRHQLQQRINELETEIVQAALVERATVVLANQSKTSRGESLRLLRREARRQRRPMWELAKVVLAADDILSARSTAGSSPQ